MIKYVSVLDIGTTGIRMLVGKIGEDGACHIVAKAALNCKCIKKYNIENEDELAAAISRITKRIEEQTEIIVKSTYVSIPSPYTGYVRNTAVINDRQPGTIGYEIVSELLDMASDTELYENEFLIDVIPSKYIIDNTTNVQDPIGMEFTDSVRIEADVVTANVEYINTLQSCFAKAGLEIDGYIPLGAAMKNMLPEYAPGKKSTLLISMGGAETEFIVYYKNHPFFTGSFPVGGMNITNDIAQVLNVSSEEAETLKKDYSIATLELVTNNVDVAVFSLDKGTQDVVKVSNIVEIMQARMEAVLRRIGDKLRQEGIQPDMIDRVIICGDGITYFSGIDRLVVDNIGSELTEVDFTRKTGMKTIYTYSSAMVNYIAGLLRYGRSESQIERKAVPMDDDTSGNIIEKVKKWFSALKD